MPNKYFISVRQITMGQTYNIPYGPYFKRETAVEDQQAMEYGMGIVCHIQNSFPKPDVR